MDAGISRKTEFENESPVREAAGTIKNALNLLIIEDSASDAELVALQLRRAGFEPRYERIESAAGLRSALALPGWDAVLSDYALPGFDGLEALRLVREAGLDLPFILISASASEDLVVEAMRLGADDHLFKDRLWRLGAALSHALERKQLRDAARQAAQAVREQEAGLRQAQEIAKLGYAIISGRDGAFERWSENLPALVALPPERMPKSAREWLTLLHPEDRAVFRAQSIEAAKNRVRMDTEYRLRRGDGVWVRFRQVIDPLPAQAGAAAGTRWFNTVQDVTEHKRVEEALRESVARFRSLTELSSDWYWEQDAQYRFVKFSGGDHHRGWGKDQHSTLGLARWQLPGVIPAGGSWDEHRTLLAARKPFRDFEYRRILDGGGVQHIAASGEPVFGAEGRFAGYRGVATDITARKQAEERIRRLNRIHMVLSGVNSAIVRIRDRTELFREICAIVMRAGGLAVVYIGVVDAPEQRLSLFGLEGTTTDFIDSVRHRLSLRDDAPEGYGPPATAVREKRIVVVNDVASDPLVLNKDKHARFGIRSVAMLPILVAGEPAAVLGLHASETGFFDEEEMKLLSELAADISFALENIQKKERLDYLSSYDPLTGLANRTLFMERVNQSIRAAGPAGGKFALVSVDLERFRAVNESFGQQAGDALLKLAAQRLKSAGGAIGVGRVGADQFALALAAVKGRSQAGRIVNDILQTCFGGPFSVGGKELRLAAKAGVALFPGDGADAESLFGHAEAALRKAKELGERHVLYSPALNERTSERLALENCLRQALEKDEFVLHYQPKVDSQTGAIAGVEALIRWQSPELGLVPPMKFIPLMEEIGLILPVGAWALKQAALDHRKWVELGIEAPRVAVNVSPIQLRQRDFVAAVEQAIIEGVAPTGIDLEITESLIMEDVQGSVEKLKAVRALGVRIAIDDFGTGYSSLGYLARLPVQTLKIDRSFIITMLADPDTMSLVSTVISLAHSLRLKVVAEGVDAEEQAKMLRLLRCDEMQGYLFSKPLPLDAITALLKKEQGQIA